MIFSRATLKIVWALALSVIVSVGQTNTLIVPSSAENRFGESFADPFFFTERGEITQIYGSSLFPDRENAPILITGIAFRKDEAERGSIDAVVPRISIEMSLFPGRLEDSSAERSHDVNRSLVFDRENVHLTAPPGTVSPNDFTLKLALDTPYVYDPSAGQLVMYIRSHLPGGRVAGIDAVPAESLYFYWDPGGTQMPRGIAMVTAFSYQVVPEPCALAILGMATFAIASRKGKGLQ